MAFNWQGGNVLAMNLRNIVFDKLDHESIPFRDKFGCEAKHIQLYTHIRGIKVYCRQLWIKDFDKFELKGETYSLDRVKWFSHLVDIQREVKRLEK